MFKFTVSKVNEFIKQIFSYEEMFYGINVEGEISNFKYHSSGHMYFTLKDEKSAISCVFFKEQADKISFLPEDGMLVVVCGDIGIYEAYGRYQIYGSRIEKCDEKGQFHKKLNDLKTRLYDEGLFNLKNKKAIPQFPKYIGVIAAKGGAAVEDVLKTISRKFPLAKVRVYYALMQGEKSVKSVVKALKFAEKDELDVLILARGGGAKEDLKTFDDEVVARHVCDLDVPIVSAIGHEKDWSVVDLVADFRASTPSAAAEIICPDIVDLQYKVMQYKNSIRRFFENAIYDFEFRLKFLKKDLLFSSPSKNIENLKEKILILKKGIYKVILKKHDEYLSLVEKQRLNLKYLNPEKIFNRGFGLILDENLKAVKSVRRGKVGKILKIRLKDGEFKVKIIEKELKDN